MSLSKSASRAPRAAPLTILFVAALLFPPTVTAVGEGSAKASLSFSETIVDADGRWRTPDSYANSCGAIKGSFHLSLKAEKLTVNWSRETVLEVADPTKPRDWRHRSTLGWTYGEQFFVRATAKGENRSGDARALVNASGSAKVDIDTSSARLGPSVLEAWNPFEETGSLAGAPLLRSSNSLLLQMENGSAVITGSFSILLWSANVNITANGTTTRFVSGNWSEPLHPGIGGDSLLRKRHFQTLKLTTVEALVEFDHSSNATWASREFSFAGSGRATFSNPKGVFEHGLVRKPLDGSVLVIDGAFGMRASNISRDPERPLVGTVVSDPKSFAIWQTGKLVRSADGIRLKEPTVPKNHVFPTLGVSLLVILSSMWAGRRNLLRIDDVEFALFRGDFEHARALATKLMGRKPRDPTVAFLLAAAYLAEGKHVIAFAKIEAIATSAPAASRPGLAFVLALAAHRASDPVRAERWREVASTNPRLLEALDDEWAKASPSNSSGQAPISAYA